jgi:hypothetical protein
LNGHATTTALNGHAIALCREWDPVAARGMFTMKKVLKQAEESEWKAASIVEAARNTIIERVLSEHKYKDEEEKIQLTPAHVAERVARHASWS